MAGAAQRERLSQNEQSNASESQAPLPDSGATRVAQTDSGVNWVAQTDSGFDRGGSQDVSFDAAVSDEERRRMIAEAAYFIALRREFDGGLELEDWLAAEAEVDAKLGRRSAS